MSPRVSPRRPEPAAEPSPDLQGCCRFCGVACLAPSTERVRSVISGTLPSPAQEDPWGRCDTCAGLEKTHRTSDAMRVALAADLLAVDLDPDDPATRRGCVPVPIAATETSTLSTLAAGHSRDVHGDYHAHSTASPHRWLPIGPGTEHRWQFVVPAQREALTAAIDKERRRGTHPRRSKHGPCGCCGRRRALRWVSPSVIVPGRNTARWPVCGDCKVIARRAGGLSSISDGSVWITAAVLGARTPGISWPPTKPYAAMRPAGTDPTTDDGYPEPWGWLADDDRMMLWRMVPQYAPPELRDRWERAERARRQMARATAVSPSALVRSDVSR